MSNTNFATGSLVRHSSGRTGTIVKIFPKREAADVKWDGKINTTRVSLSNLSRIINNKNSNVMASATAKKGASKTASKGTSKGAAKGATKAAAPKGKAATKAAAAAKEGEVKGPGKIEQIIALHVAGKSNKEIVEAGFNKTTVSIQVSKYKKSL